MQATSPQKQTWQQRSVDNWNRFWFTPADPTVLGLMRICCGLIVFYTVAAYTFTLQDFLGEHAWFDVESNLRQFHERPYAVDGRLNGDEAQRVGSPKDKFERDHLEAYQNKWGQTPPAPYPVNTEQEEYIDRFLMNFGQDPRRFNCPLPTTEEQRKYLESYTQKRGQPPPGYPKDELEDKAIEEYVDFFGYDPRRLYSKGTPVWSLWFHLTDPTGMMVAHLGICLAVFFFLIGFCTRITSVLTWMGSLFYIHRAQLGLFGFDTMLNIVLLYLAIGPSGAAFSVDRLIARWWSTAKPRVVNRWRALWRLPAVEVTPAAYAPLPPKSVTANLAIRLLQIHVCFIYCGAGLSKLQGQAWWRGDAIWSVIANFEFAPMQYHYYQEFLRTLAQNKLAFNLFLVGGSYFTVFFEICYSFLIWRKSTRWLMLAMAVVLHGFIGIFMGLRTFSLVMLVMNLAFLRPEEARWLVGMFRLWKTSPGSKLPDTPAAA